MRWQPGGNLEPVRIICETDWKQCIRAILKYIWMEVVIDVVDCLTTEVTLWREGLYTCKIIVFCVICLLLLLLLLRIFYIKRKWIINRTTPPSKYILNSVGCKVDDLELKINILTYKFQYGTWPLPHQIRNPNLKNLRLTLSTSNDRNAWIKHMLLNSTSNIYLSPTKMDSTSVHHMTKLFDTKTGYVSSEIKRDVSSLTNQSDIKLFQTSSVESIKKTNLEDGVHQLGGFSKSENLGESRRISLLQGKNNDYSLKKMRKHKNPRFAKSRMKIMNACDKYTQSIEECKRFLRDLKESNKRLELNCSSSAISNDSSSFLESFTDEKSSLHAQTTDARNARNRRCEIIGHVKETIVKVEREEDNNPETFVDTSNGVLQIDKIKYDRLLPSFQLNVHDDSTTNILSKNDNVILMSQEETLNQIKRKLESLDNVLRTYGVLDSSIKESKDKSNDIQTIYRNVVDTLDEMKIQIENINEIKRNKFYFDFNTKECNDKMLQTTSSDWELFESIDDSEKSSNISMKSYSLGLIEDSLNDSMIIEENNQLKKKSNEELYKIEPKLELYRSNQDLILDEKLILTRSYLQKEDNKDLLTELWVPMETTDDEPSTTNSSQLEETQSKDSDLENKSTEMLIEEALQCKKELMSRVQLDKLYSNFEIMNKREQTTENNFYNVNYTWLEKEKNSLKSKLLDIITEESISNCTDKTSGTYIFLQSKPSTNEISSLSLNMEINDKKEENIIIKENVIMSEIKLLNNLSKQQIIPVNSSEYFSLNDLSIVSEHENISLRELTNDSKSSLINKNNKPIKNVYSLNGKRRLKEIATWDDDDDMDDYRKRKCHREEEIDKKSLISYEELRRTKSFNMSFCKKRNINDIVLTRSMKNNNIENYNELFTRIRNNDDDDNNEKKEIIVEKDDLLSLNRTTDSSSGASIKYQLMIDNGSMTNLFSSTDSNLKSNRCSSSIVKMDDILYDHNLSLKRRPGMLSFTQLKMNTVISDKKNDLFQNPYFLAETTLSEITCGGETIEFNFIPISVSIDTHESNIFSMTRENIFGDIKNELSSSALCISYNNDRENDKVIEMIENEAYESNEREMQIIQKDNRKNIFHISEHATTMNIVDHKYDENDNVQETMILNDWERLDKMISQHNVISQQSSSYFTGDTTNSINKIDFDSYQESLSNIKMNDYSVQEIDISNDILECCIDSCIDLLRKKETNKNNNKSLQLEDVRTSNECIFNNNDANNKTSISNVEKNDYQLFDEIKSNMNVLENKSEGFIFDGSIQYKKPYLIESNLKKNTRTGNSNYNSKSKTINNNIKSKEPINVTERMTYSKRYAMNNNNNNYQLKEKSNLNIIFDNKDLQGSDSCTKSYTRPNSCNLSREKSRSKGNIYKNDFTSRSAVFSRSNDRSKEEQKNDQIKFKSETHSKCSVLTPKSFSKSCIPVLKSRLNSRKTEHIYRPKSPMRGPLTMTGLCRNKIHTNDENLNEVNVIPTEGNSINKEESQQHLDNSNKILFKTGSSSSKEEKVNVIDEKDCNNIVAHEQTIIYVNIINHNDRNVTRILDPEKFLEYNTKVEPIAQNNVNNESSDTKFQDKVTSPSVIMTQEKNTLPKVVTILSSITNKATDIDSNDPKSLSNLHISSGTFKNFWSLTIQQKEMEVSVKPSVTDTSTSMSDFFKIKEIMMPFNEHRIFGIPKELTNEEYSYLFEILTHKQNLGHLKEIQNLCNKLRLRNTNFD